MSDDIAELVEDVGETMQHIVHQTPTTPAPGGFFQNIGVTPLTTEGAIVHAAIGLAVVGKGLSQVLNNAIKGWRSSN